VSPGLLEAFSDGVIAIIITIMVLDMKAPDNAHLEALKPVLPVFGVTARNGNLSTLRRSRGSFVIKKCSRIRLQLV
jgi:hypothetical protein